MSSLSTLPKGDSAWLLRKSIQRIMQQVSVLETNIGSSTTGNSANTQVIFNDAGTLRGDAGLTYNKTTDLLTVGAATITGDLTVDTSTLKVDSTNNRVGIGTTTPACKLEVVAPAGDNIVSTFRSGDATAANNAGGGFQSISSATAASRVARVWLDADGADLSGGDYFFIQKNGNSGTVEFNQSSNAAMTFLTNGTERYRIASDGVATWSNVGGVAGTAMTLNSTGLGVGASPSYQIHARKDQAAFTSVAVDNQSGLASGTGSQFLLLDAGTATGWFRRQRDGTGNTDIGYKDTLRFRGAIAGTERTDMLIDSSGNVGIGVTPSAWVSGSPAVQLKYNSSIWAFTDNSIQVNQNAFYDGAWKYINAASLEATNYYQNAGKHIWRNAIAGTAGNTITWEQAMTLDASGNLLVGGTSGSFRGTFVVAGGADRDILIAGVTSVSGGFQVKWNNSTSKINVIIENIPTSSAGLATGTLWNDAGTIKIA